MKKISGTGSVFYNNSKKLWVAQYVLTEDGVSKKKSLYGPSKESVSRRLSQIMYDYHNNDYIEQNGIPLIQIVTENREDKYAANLISDSHYSRLTFVLNEIANSSIGQMNISEITTRDLQKYFNSLITRYTDSSIKKVWETVKQGFQVAMKEKYIRENPFDNLLKPKSKKDTKVMQSLTVEEQEIFSQYLLLSKLKKEKYKNVFLIQLYTGMRIGEVLALSKDNIDFKNNIIKVRKTVSVTKDGKLTVKNRTKTYSGKRDLPMQSFLVDFLKEQLKIMVKNENDLIFTYEGKILIPSTMNTILKRIRKKLNIATRISTHTLRHTFGTRCIESGMSPVVVQRLMGHKDIKVTLNTYTTVLNQFKEDELQKVAKLYLEKNFLNLPDNTIALKSGDYTKVLESE